MEEEPTIPVSEVQEELAEEAAEISGLEEATAAAKEMADALTHQRKWKEGTWGTLFKLTKRTKLRALGLDPLALTQVRKLRKSVEQNLKQGPTGKSVNTKAGIAGLLEMSVLLQHAIASTADAHAHEQAENAADASEVHRDTSQDAEPVKAKPVERTVPTRDALVAALRAGDTDEVYILMDSLSEHEISDHFTKHTNADVAQDWDKYKGQRDPMQRAYREMKRAHLRSGASDIWKTRTSDNPDQAKSLHTTARGQSRSI